MIDADVRNLRKWLNEEQICDIDRQALARVLAHYALDKKAENAKELRLDYDPQRTWVGLTIEEREQIQQECFGKVPHHVAFAHAIEAKLKEKNNG